MATMNVSSERLQGICRHYRIARLDVFGSEARGDATDSSDIDLLYTLAEGTHLGWEIEDLAAELAELLGRPVDLVSRAALHGDIRAAVLNDARLLYAAARVAPGRRNDHRS